MNQLIANTHTHFNVLLLKILVPVSSSVENVFNTQSRLEKSVLPSTYVTLIVIYKAKMDSLILSILQLCWLIRFTISYLTQN